MEISKEDVFWVSGPTVHVFGSLHRTAGLTDANKFLGYQLPSGRYFVIVGSDYYDDVMVRDFAERIKYIAGDVDRLSLYCDEVDLQKPVIAGDLIEDDDKVRVRGWSSMRFGVSTLEEHRDALKEVLEVPLPISRLK